MSYIIRETYYLKNDCGMYPIRLTPDEFFRYNKQPYNRNGIDSQIRAEFTNLTNFNDIKDEKYIEL